MLWEGVSMSAYELLHFNTAVAAKKPYCIANPQVKCPFCDRGSLVNILAEDYPILLVMNKYPVLKDTYPTVLVETADCQQEFSDYPKEHLHKVISFGVKKWLEFENSQQFASVIFYKSHGPLSGGTVKHPHMQIIGLNTVNCYKNVLPEHFEGIIIDQKDGVEFNLATKPRTGYTEFNITLTNPKLAKIADPVKSTGPQEELQGLELKDYLNPEQLNQFADYTQMATHFSLHYFHKNCNSYNIFFYRLDDRIIAKVIPRFVTSPLYIGYSLPQVSDNQDAILRIIREKYF
jgi:hypothetical protein